MTNALDNLYIYIYIRSSIFADQRIGSKHAARSQVLSAHDDLRHYDNHVTE